MDIPIVNEGLRPLQVTEVKSASGNVWLVTKVPTSSLLRFEEEEATVGYDVTLPSATRGHSIMSSPAAKKSTPLPSFPVLLFARNFLKHPSMLGSVVPSSPFLVKDLLRQVDWENARVLVEYGPGVGTITREILKRMRPDAVLVSIELNDDFAQYLEHSIRDPRFRVVHGSAADIRRILAEQQLANADCIISGLPYSLMTDALRRTMLEESRQALSDQGSMLVFQYSRMLLPCLESSFSSVRRNFQFFNILPAQIFHCTP